MKNGLYVKLITNHPLANISFVLVLLAGLVTYVGLPRAQDPEINFNWVNIITTLPGALAEDIENEITNPLEDALSRVKDIKFISSSSRENISSILVRFEDIPEALFDKRMNDLRREVQNAANTELPADSTEPQIMEITSSNGFPTAMMAVVGQGGGETLRRAAYLLQKEMEEIPGVDRVMAMGLDSPRLMIEFDPLRLSAHGLNPSDLSQSVAGWFRNTLAGRLKAESEEWLVRLEGKTSDPQSLAEIALIGAQGHRTALGDVAHVFLGHDRTAQEVRYQGRNAVLFSITKSASANTLGLVQNLGTFMTQRNSILANQGIELVMLDDQTHPTKNAIGIMETNAFFGLVAVLLMCWFFLGSRLALLVALGIPFSLAATFGILGAIDSTLNLTVLLGVVIALGMVVDDAVVIIEAVYYRMERGQAALDAVLEGVREVAAPVVSSILTTIAAFLPLMLLPGILGKFMFVVPFVVTVALLISLVEAFWILPAHVLAIRPDFQKKRTQTQILRERFTRVMRREYGRLLVKVMRRPVMALLGMLTVVALALGLVASGVIKQQFFASDTLRLCYIHVDLPPGSTLTQTILEAERVAKEVESRIDPEELRSVTAVSGIKFTETEPLYGDHHGQVIVALHPHRPGTPETDALIDGLRAPIMALEGVARLHFLELKGGPPTSRPISVKVQTDDPVVLRAAANALMKTLATMEGVHGITDDAQAGRVELRLRPDREKLARAGIHPGELARQIRLLGEGEAVGNVRILGEKTEVWVRAQPRTLEDISSFLEKTIRLPDGRAVPIESLVQAETHVAQGYIRHYQRIRTITVEADIDTEKTDTLKANTALLAAWEVQRAAFPSVKLDFSGELDDIKESLDAMLSLFLLGLGLIYLILATQFRSYFQPLIILSTIPLAFTGVVLGLLVSGNPLSLYTLYGVIALTGIAVNSAIVLIDAANERRAAGMSVLHAAILAARRRVVPVFITSVTTMGGLFSLAIGLGGKSLIWGPVAASIVWGLGFSTLLTLFAVPVIYRLVMSEK
jgi:multidrug efflux pump subunit AcrB